MTKKYKILAVLILLFLGLLTYLEATKPTPINWYPSYGNTDKIPFGLKVFHTTLKDRFSESFKEVNLPPFKFMQQTDTVQGTYLFINSDVNFDKTETHRLLDWVKQGNTIYVASSSISETLLDTLSLKTAAYYDLDNFNRTPVLNLSNPSLSKTTPYELDIEVAPNYFSKIDTANTTVLGVFDIKKEDTSNIAEPKVHFIRQPYGDGFVYLHLFPIAFTNYFMLHEENYTYTNGAQLYLNDNQTVYWDNHYKNSKTFYSSPLYMIFKNKHLKWAWYILLVGVFLWVLFEGKRKQRAIPIVTPLENQSIAYTHTIAGMYLEKSDHKSIAHHQINHFLEYLRSTHGIDTSTLGLDFIAKAAAKTDNTEQVTKAIVDLIVTIQQTEIVTEIDLKKLTNRIEAFKKR